MSLPTTKKVNGKSVNLKAAEKAAIQAEWDAEEAKPVPPKSISLNELTRAEMVKLINMLRTDNVISAARATEIKG